MEQEPTNSYNYVFFSCINNGKIFIKNTGNEEEIAIGRDFYNKLKNLDFSFKDSKFYVCVGPGSYTGIRQTVAFFMGIQMVKNIRLYTFTLFDYFKYVYKKELKNKNKLIINGFPFSINENYRGFGLNIKTAEYFYYNDNAFCSDCFWVKNPADVIQKDKVFDFIKHAQQQNIFKTNLEPLYINPVHITKSKKHA